MLATVYHNHETNPSVLLLPGVVQFIQSATQEGGENELAKGSVVLRSGNWYAVYRDGVTQKWERAGSSKRAAEKLLAKRMNQINAGTYQEF